MVETLVSGPMILVLIVEMIEVVMRHLIDLSVVYHNLEMKLICLPDQLQMHVEGHLVVVGSLSMAVWET